MSNLARQTMKNKISYLENSLLLTVNFSMIPINTLDDPRYFI